MIELKKYDCIERTCYELVPLRGKNHFKTRPQDRILVSPVVLFKMSHEQPGHFHMGVSPDLTENLEQEAGKHRVVGQWSSIFDSHLQLANIIFESVSINSSCTISTIAKSISNPGIFNGLLVKPRPSYQQKLFSMNNYTFCYDFISLLG